MGWDVLVLVLYKWISSQEVQGLMIPAFVFVWCCRCVCPIVVIHSKCSEVTLGVMEEVSQRYAKRLRHQGIS